MCCTSEPSRLFNTITGTYEVSVDNKIKHVSWYQNSVKAQLDSTAAYIEAAVGASVQRKQQGLNWKEMCLLQVDLDLVEEEVEWRITGKPKRSWNGTDFSLKNGNCLIMPLPGSWESIYLLNTVDVPSILLDIYRALTPVKLTSLRTTLEPAFGNGGFDNFSGRIAFIKYDFYDIVLAECAADIDKILPQIEPAKRPRVNPEFFAAMEKLYRCPFALCCFNELDSFTSAPIAFAYEPNRGDTLMVYTLDAHDGKAPKIDSVVEMDHAIFVGSQISSRLFGGLVSYSDKLPDHLQPYLLKSVMGLDINSLMENGDIYFSTDDVRHGVLKGYRMQPPGAAFEHKSLSTTTITRDEDYEYSGS